MDLKFDPEYIPDAAECASLTSLTKMPGYGVQHKILKSVVDKFLVELREANTEDANECVERIRRSQISAEIYQLMVDRVNTYVSAYTIAEDAANTSVLPDETADILDMDFTKDVDKLADYFVFEEGQL